MVEHGSAVKSGNAAINRDLVLPNGAGKPDGHFLHKLKPIAKRAGVEEAEPHRFRKTYADTLNEDGISVNMIGRGPIIPDVESPRFEPSSVEGLRFGIDSIRIGVAPCLPTSSSATLQESIFKNVALVDWAEGEITCPHCGSHDVEQVWSAFSLFTSQKSA